MESKLIGSLIIAGGIFLLCLSSFGYGIEPTNCYHYAAHCHTVRGLNYFIPIGFVLLGWIILKGNSKTL